MDTAMSGRNRRAGGPKGTALNTPFRELRKLVPNAPAAAARRPPQRSTRSDTVPTVDDEEALFRSALEDVVPMSPEARNQAGPPRRRTGAGSPRLREEAEVLWALSELVSGNGSFEVSDTDEHMEGWVIGLDPRVVQKLRAGWFAYQAHLDLHGMTAAEASLAVRQFVLRALRAGHRCLLVVHGRGRNSRDRRPVLKDRLRSWLSHGELARVVLAFASARPCDGGGGATYVLLRRERRQKKPFTTLSGKS
jgi:DNA-nicking Smr family endonuclease